MKRSRRDNAGQRPKRFRMTEQFLPAEPICADKYPCSVCAHETDQGSIECTTCKMWTHGGCLTVDTFSEWVGTDLFFHCPQCACTNNVFDLSKCLER